MGSHSIVVHFQLELDLSVYRCGVAVLSFVSDQRSLFSTWIGDCLQAGNHLSKQPLPAAHVDSAFYPLWDDQLSGSLVIDGDVECSTIAASLGGSVAPTGLFQRSARRLSYIRQMN